MVTVTNTDNLPRVTTIINDGGLRIAPPEAGPKITLLGTTTSTGIGVREIFLVDNAPKAIRNLRHANGAPSELSIAVEEAIVAGATNIEVMKIATESGELDGYTDWRRYDDLGEAYDTLLHQPVDVVAPVGAYIDATGVDTGTDTFGNSRTNLAKQLANFCYQSTKEHNTAFGVIGLRPVLETARMEAWTGATPAAQATATGSWFGTPTLAQVKEWVNHAIQESGALRDHSTEDYFLDYLLGSVEDSPGVVSSTYQSQWTALESDGSSATDNNALWVDAGQYISVIAAPNRYYGSEAELFAVKQGVTGVKYVNGNGATAYGAKLSALDPHIAATNKTLGGQRAARAVSSSQGRSLLRHRLVSMISKSTGYVVTSAISGAHNASAYTRSDFVRVSTVRITHAVADVVRQRGEPFIGSPISGPFLSALETEIESSLIRIQKTGALRQFDFSIVSSPDQQVLGEIDINLSIVPGFELVTINSIISLTKGEGIG